MKRLAIIAHLATVRRCTSREAAAAANCSQQYAKVVLGKECHRSDRLGYYADEAAWLERVLRFVERNEG
jgi:hypothetical protein